MSLKTTHVIAAACLVLVSWSSSGYSAERTSVLDDYYRDTPPNSAYLGKMKAKWASHVKARHQVEPVDLMPAKPVSRLVPERAKPVQTVTVTRIVPKSVVVPRMTPKATVRRFIAPNRPALQPAPVSSTERALPFWSDL